MRLIAAASTFRRLTSRWYAPIWSASSASTRSSRSWWAWVLATWWPVPHGGNVMASYPGRSQEGGAFERERAAPDTHANDSTVSDLISGLVSDAQQLVHREIDLAKREMAIEVEKVKQGAVALGV